MKKKRVLSVLCALLLLCTVFAGIVSADTVSVLEATTFPLLNGLGLGVLEIKYDQRAYVYPQSAHNDASVTATTVESLTGLSDRPMLQLDATTKQVLGAELNNKTADNSAFQFVTGFNSSQAFMFYVKAANSTDDTLVWMRLKTIPDQAVAANTERYIFIQNSKPYYTLAKGDTQWTAAQSPSDYHFKVPSGFEGWIRVPFSSYTADYYNGGNNDYDWLYNVELRFSEVGGEAGPAIMGAPMVITNDCHSLAVKVDGSAQALDLFTGEVVAAPQAPHEPKEPQAPENPENPENPGNPDNPPAGSADVSGITAADQFAFLKGNTPDAEIPLNTMPYIGLGSNIYRDAISIKPIAPLSGVSDYAMLQVDTAGDTETPVTELTAYSETSKVFFEFGNQAASDWQDISDMDSFMFYVKMPQTPGKTGFWFHLHAAGTNLDGSLASNTENSPQMTEGARYYMLAKGETEWKAAAAPAHKFVETDSGFEGWIRVPASSLQDAYYNKQEGILYKMLYKWTVSLKEFGGSYGPLVLGAPLIVTNDDYSAAAVTLDNSGVIRNLFTGEEMDREEVFPPLEPGDEVLSLPDASTDKEVLYPEDGDITSRTAKIKWEAFEGAAGYRLEVYRNAISNDTMVYVFLNGYDVTGTEQLIDGLEASLRYTVLVRALDADGKELAIYETLAFSAADEEIGGDADTDESIPSDRESASPDTGDAGIAAGLLLVVLSAAVLSVLRLSKTRGNA